MPLIYVEVEDDNGRMRVQRLDKLPDIEQAAVLARTVRRFHEVSAIGTISENVQAGRTRQNGADIRPERTLLKHHLDQLKEGKGNGNAGVGTPRR
jgi:hypothetical protein